MEEAKKSRSAGGDGCLRSRWSFPSFPIPHHSSSAASRLCGSIQRGMDGGGGGEKETKLFCSACTLGALLAFLGWAAVEFGLSGEAKGNM